MATPTTRTGHPYFMYDEMQAQPDAMAAALTADTAQRDHIAIELAGTHRSSESIVGPGFLMPSIVGPGRIWLTGCGTAYHAALTGAYWLSHATGGVLDVAAAQALEFAHYGLRRARVHDTLLALSHSGTPIMMAAAAARAKEEGMYTLALTAASKSPLVDICDETLITTTAQTVASTYTISHLTMLSVLADLVRRTVGHLKHDDEQVAVLNTAIASFPALTQQALASETQVRAIVDALPASTNLIVAGGGPNWPTALEWALKVREAAYLPAIGMQIEEVIHGPIASIDPTTIVVVIAPPGAARDRAPALLGALRYVGATTIAVGAQDDTELAAMAQHFIALPDCAEIFSVIPATTLAQQFAYWLAMRRGGHPDRIRRDQPEWNAARESYTR